MVSSNNQHNKTIHMKKQTILLSGFILGITLLVTIGASLSSDTSPPYETGQLYQFTGATPEVNYFRTVTSINGHWVKVEAQQAGSDFKDIRWINIDHVSHIIPHSEREKANVK